MLQGTFGEEVGDGCGEWTGSWPCGEGHSERNSGLSPEEDLLISMALTYLLIWSIFLCPWKFRKPAFTEVADKSNRKRSSWLITEIFQWSFCLLQNVFNFNFHVIKKKMNLQSNTAIFHFHITKSFLFLNKTDNVQNKDHLTPKNYFRSLTFSFKILKLGLLLTFFLNRARVSSSDFWWSPVTA